MKKVFVMLTAIVALSSCGKLTSQLEEKEKMLQDRLNQLDSSINAEVEKVLSLDTLINQEKAKLDSLMNIENRLLGK